MAIKVTLWGEDVGYLDWDKDRMYSRFKFDKSFLDKGIEISPIHLRLSEKIYAFPGLPQETFKGLPGVFADSLPDRFGEALMNTYFRKEKQLSLTPLDRLAYIGKRGMGALEYVPSKNPYTKETAIKLSELEELAAYGIEKANSLNTHIEPDNANGFNDILSIGASAGGARAKAVIAWNEESNEIRSGQIEHGQGFNNWLIKLDVGSSGTHLGDSQGFGKVEYTYHEMASESGIKMQRCKLMEENGRGHFLTERFDRQHGEKQHIHTLCGIRHLDYHNILNHSYNDIFQTARFLKVPYEDREQLFRQMVFNVVAANCDDHTKNFSFILNKNKGWRTTPAYDLCYSYDPVNPWVNGHMAINNKRQEITRKDLQVEGRKNSIRDYDKIIDQVIESVSKWKELAVKNGVPNHLQKLIQGSINESYSQLEKEDIRKEKTKGQHR